MNYFCTYFNINYLSRALVLFESLKTNAKEFRLFVLCFDEQSYEILTQLAYKEIILMKLGDFENRNQDLLKVKPTRSNVEYFFTSTSVLVYDILTHNPEIDSIAYLDADLYFFDDYDKILQEIGDQPIAIIPHRFSNEQKYLGDTYGIYNVGYLYFKNNEKAVKCLEHWKMQCLEWCYDYAENGKYADQKYLDKWPENYPGTYVIQHLGIGLAPWNIGQYSLSYEDGKVYINGQELILFHYHAFRETRFGLYEPGLLNYNAKMNGISKKHIFQHYKVRLEKAKKFLKRNFDLNIDTIQRSAKANTKIKKFIKNFFKGAYIR